jgi:hypothetical protein
MAEDSFTLEGLVMRFSRLSRRQLLENGKWVE